MQKQFYLIALQNNKIDNNDHRRKDERRTQSPSLTAFWNTGYGQKGGGFYNLYAFRLCPVISILLLILRSLLPIP
jgi:hypothetical protein